jgi:hypothetical protein
LEKLPLAREVRVGGRPPASAGAGIRPPQPRAASLPRQASPHTPPEVPKVTPKLSEHGEAGVAARSPDEAAPAATRAAQPPPTPSRVAQSATPDIAVPPVASTSNIRPAMTRAPANAPAARPAPPRPPEPRPAQPPQPAAAPPPPVVRSRDPAAQRELDRIREHWNKTRANPAPKPAEEEPGAFDKVSDRAAASQNAGAKERKGSTRQTYKPEK